MKTFNRFITLLFLVSCCVLNAWGTVSTLTFTAKCNGSGTADDGATWTVASDADESTYSSDKGVHYGTGSAAVSYLRLTTSSISGTISKIVVNASGASSTSAKLNVTVGGSAFGTEKSLTSSAAEYELTGSATGTIVVSITQSSAKKAVYCKSIAVTYASDCTPPTITSQPTGAVYNKDATPTALSITATGTSVTYQWYSNTTNSTAGATSLTGQTSSSYTPSTATAGTTYYYCVASSSSCNTRSNIVAVRVKNPPFTVRFYTGVNSTTYIDRTESAGEVGVTPPDARPYCSGWTFQGWSESYSASSTSTTPLAIEHVSGIYHPTKNTTLYPVYTKDGVGSPTLTQINTGGAIYNGDKIVILARDTNVTNSNWSGVDFNKQALYQEAGASKTVQKWDASTLNASVVGADNKKWLLVTTTEGGFYLGDDTYGYLYASGNDLYVRTDGNKSIWSLTDFGSGKKFKLEADNRYLSLRVDLASVYWKMGGQNHSNSGQTILYLYKYNAGTGYYSFPGCDTISCYPPTSTETLDITSSSATLSWAMPSSIASDGYLVAYSTSSAKPDDDVVSTGGGYTVVSVPTGTSYNLTSLTDNTTYYWWVRSDCGAEMSTWSETRSFKTKISVTLSIDGTTTTTSQNIPYILPTSIPDACGDWKFYGWTTTERTATNNSTPLELVTKATTSGTYYAVYVKGSIFSKNFYIKDIATTNSWSNNTQHTSISDSPITLTASGGTSGTYFSSDHSWRFYSSASGTLTVSASGGNNILMVKTAPSKEFTISGSTATYEAESNTSFRNIEVTYYTGTVYFSTSNTCCKAVSNPIVSVASHSTTATISWNEQAGASLGYNVTIPDASVDVDLAAGTTAYTVSGLSSGTEYYYTVTAKAAADCERTSTGTFTTELGGISIAAWDTADVYLDLGIATTATAIVENQNTQAVIKQNYADSLFFSKYFEAPANVKMLAIYNGTDHTIDLSNYSLAIAQTGGDAAASFSYTKFSEMHYYTSAITDDYFTPEQLQLGAGKEIILISYDITDADNSIIRCAQENPKSGYTSYFRLKTPKLQFNGDDAVGLLNPDDNYIDLIGARNSGTDKSDISSVVPVATNAGDANGFMDTPGGWYSDDGINIQTNDSNYAISTNRCLLIRKNTVKTGLNAVTRNTTDFVTLGGTYGEWKGLQMPGTTGGDGEGITNACEGFDYVGSYDYNAYYAKFDTIMKSTDISGNRQSDGTYKIHIPGLDEMSCTNLRVTVVKDGTEKVNGVWKVPIMVWKDTVTTSTLFTKEGDDCATCDVAVLRNAKLTVADGGKNTARTVEVYHDAKFVVPAGQTYNVNQLIMRSKDDTVARADIRGNVVQTMPIFAFDKRIKATRWYKIALPYRCRISDVEFRSGESAEYGTDWVLKTYDGDRRANGTEGGNWKVYNGTYMEPGVGYNLAINSDILEFENGYAELHFPMTANPNFSENASVTVPVTAYGKGRVVGGKAVTPNHLGWNLIGNPYMLNYTTGSVTTPLTVGRLDPDGLTYKLTDTGLRYVVELNQNTKLYSQIALGDAGKEMDPFIAYFVQVTGASDNESLSVIFDKIKQAGRSPVRRAPQDYAEEDTHVIWVPFTLTNSYGEEDETTLLLSNRFTNSYDLMDDLGKWRGDKYYNYSNPVLATRNDDGEMAFNALPDSTAKTTGVPVNFYAGVTGEYQFALSGKYGLNEVREVMLYDLSTHQYYNLMEQDYFFNANKGNNTDRFRLYVTVDRKKIATGNEFPTYGELSLSTLDRTLVLSGLTDVTDIYVYDISGKLMTSARAGGHEAVWRTNVPAQGVYFVRVNSINGQQTLRTIVK